MARPNNQVISNGCYKAGGWGGIRTLETLARLPVFKTGALNHSATHPALRYRRGLFPTYRAIGTGLVPELVR